MSMSSKSVVVLLVVGFAGLSAAADDYVTYLGAIPVDKPLGRIVADPVRAKVYGITENGDVVFIDRNSWSVENVVSTGRVLRDIDLHPSNNHLTVLDNVTGEYWGQPPAVYVLDFDLASQEPSGIVLAEAPLYQMAHGRADRIIGVETNQWVSVYQLDASSGALLDTAGGGYYGGSTWMGPNLFATNSSGTRLYRTDIGISSIDVLAFDISTDEIVPLGGRQVGSYGTEPVFINSTDTSLYVGDIRLDPDNLSSVLGVYPETILAATGDDSLAFGAGGVYDPVWGDRLQDMPVSNDMMVLGEDERYLYSFDTGTQQLHVMRVVPEPSTLALLTLGGCLVPRRRK